MLTDTAIKALKPTEHQFKRGDSEGLFLLVRNGEEMAAFRLSPAGR